MGEVLNNLCCVELQTGQMRKKLLDTPDRCDIFRCDNANDEDDNITLLVDFL